MERTPDYEKLGVFYLGRQFNPIARQRQEDLILYKSKDLTRHAVCVGMTGSGKTGLCIGLLEEAAIDGIPALVIDPKGDMSNLLLTFPGLKGEDFLPWVNEDDARHKGQSTAEYASAQAEQWKSGLAEWAQDGQRIARFERAVERVIYTPGSTTGTPISILKSFNAPAQGILDDTELLGERVETTITSLLGLMGIQADPMKSREHVLLSHLLLRAWQNDESPDLASLIHQIQEPPMQRVGVMSVDSFFPAKDRFQLALALNNVIAAPTFSQWLEGRPMDIGSMLYGDSGKPRLSIVSIAHLSEEQRMFFVSMLLNEVVGWVRSQAGTSSLRAILYMDEIFGFFPPVANPPSKRPLLTLLKQARAHGLGVVLTTQNPADLDYKGLSNAGTWFIGRLQAERDKARVIEGLEGASASAGKQFNRAETERIIAGLGNRVFLLNNVSEDDPTVFETRWALSYLRGPLTRVQLRQLALGHQPALAAGSPVTADAAGLSIARHTMPAITSSQPALPPGIPQLFIPVRGVAPAGHRLVYEPAILGSAQVGFVDRKTGGRYNRSLLVITDPTTDAVLIDWSNARELDIPLEDMTSSPAMEAAFGSLPLSASRKGSYTAWKRDLADWLYANQTVDLLTSPELKLISIVGEAEKDFRLRVSQAARERRDAETDRLRKKYETKVAGLRNQIFKAEQGLQRQQEQAKQQKTQFAI